jgi:hypothetical protein
MVLSLSSMQNVMVTLGKNLKPIFDKLDDASMNKTLSELSVIAAQSGGKLTVADNEQLSFPTANDLKSAIEKTFTPTDGVKGAIQAGVQAGKDESGGFFSKVVGFFKNLFSSPPTEDTKIRDALVSNVMELTPEELLNAATAAEEGARSLEAPAQQGAEAGTEASAGATAAAGEAAAAAAEEPIGRADWTKDATDEPDKFVDRVNKRAGKKILESRSVDRWAQLAGLRENKSR